MKKICFLIISLCVYTNCVIAQSTLTPVDADSKVHFVIKNFGIKTCGDFKGLKGNIKFYPANPAIIIGINRTSINRNIKS